jgi:hypothetical protein
MRLRRGIGANSPVPQGDWYSDRYTDRDGAEGVGFEPTDSLLSSAFKALALGHYANPPEPASRPDPILSSALGSLSLARD